MNSRWLGIYAAILPLVFAACSSQDPLACTGNGEDVLRCRAELSGDPEVQELVELMFSEK